MTGIRAVLRRLRGLPPDGAVEKVNTLRRHVDEARRAVQEWKAQAAALSGRVAELSRRLDAAQQAIAASRTRELVSRHEVPTPTAVRSTFPHRLRTLAARTARVDPAAREAHLLAASAAYRDIAVSGPASLGRFVHRMSLEGLAWWVPVPKPETGMTQAWIDKQRLPYHGIVQTREVAIGGVMLDLGAHIGRMSIPRVVLGDVTAAYCAEPDPVNYACLVGNVIDNGLRGVVLPDQTAIGDVNGTVRFRRTGAPSAFRVSDGGVDERTIEVPCTTLDTWVAKMGVDLDAVTFVKVDVEGFEQRLVRGAAGVLARRHIAWQMEIKPEGLRGNGDDPRGLYTDLARAFTHFIDLNRKVSTTRVRPTTELEAALAYIEPDGKTDILLFNDLTGGQTPLQVDSRG